MGTFEHCRSSPYNKNNLDDLFEPEQTEMISVMRRFNITTQEITCMSQLGSEPLGTVTSMAQLFALAAAMERAAIDGYTKLAKRMRNEGRLDLADVFDHLIAEERMHLENVDHWCNAVTGTDPNSTLVGWDPQASYDDEGIDIVAPELLSAYRAFSVAVRNEERAFHFWSYLAAQASSPELRTAAEQMAREELEHVATLRRERRRAFHAHRSRVIPTELNWTLESLERRLSELLESASRATDADGLALCAAEASKRANELATLPLGESPLLVHIPTAVTQRPLPCAELLFECYLDFIDRLPLQSDRDRTQAWAMQLLQCLSAIRDEEVST